MAMTYRRVSIDGDALVVVFDMCSSSDVIEELNLTGDLERHDGLLTSLKEYLADAQERVLFDPYKFTGDGWILLLPRNTNGGLAFTFLRDLCHFFKKVFDHRVLRHLATPPTVTGLTFGIEKGPLRAMTMYGRREYVGRALNIACRLQTSIKDKDADPAYKALVSNAAFNQCFSSVRSVKIWKVRRRLRNIRGGSDFHCKKIEFLNPRPA
jgi:hypothetical protein